jgi:uncharacterized protein
MRALLALALLATACTPAAPAAEAKPALWKLSDADTTIYLFGTIHILPHNLKWQTPRMEAAMNAADTLVLEAVLDAAPQSASVTMATLGTSPNLPPLLDRVPPAKRAVVQAAVSQAGLSMASLDKLETWAAALTLGSTGMAALDATHEDGAEQVLLRKFRGAHKPVSGLETPAEQLGYFDTLPEAAQRVFLISVAEDTSDPKAEYAAMLKAWTSGNERAIALSYDDTSKLSPALADALVRQRNTKWTRWIAARMAQPGTVFVAVGAGHLAGANSLEAMLAAKGLKAVRVQ